MSSQTTRKNVTVSGGVDGLILGDREPGTYDHQLFVRVFFLSIIIMGSVIVATVIWALPKGSGGYAGPKMDLSSMFIEGDSRPDPKNPCLVVQSHLEATRRGMYKTAYSFLSKDLKARVSPEAFEDNARGNRLLFLDIQSYRFPDYNEEQGLADVKGTISYGFGGVSRVEARLVRENNEWKISETNLVFQ